MKKKAQFIKLIVLGILLGTMTNVARSEEVITTNWEIVDGIPTAWDFLAGEIQCEVANTGMHRILSKKTIEGDWIIEAEIECSNNRSCPSQSIHFSIAEDYSYGHIHGKRPDLHLSSGGFNLYSIAYFDPTLSI